MKVSNLFSKRNSPVVREDTYTYDTLPQKLRVQIVHIINDAYGDDSYDHQKLAVFKEFHDIICREEGIFRLQQVPRNPIDDLLTYFMSVEEYDKALDVVELVFSSLPNVLKLRNYFITAKPRIMPDDAVEELNHRFRENGVGYQFVEDVIIRSSDTYTHNEIVRPALTLVAAKKFKTVNEEFLGAHLHFREGRYRECLVDCLKAFESTLKLICRAKSWAFKDGDTAQSLIKIVFDNKLIPDFMQSQIGAVRSTLESGVPTIRNKLGGHGQGDKSISVDEYIAHYALNLTGTTIVMLIEATET